MKSKEEIFNSHSWAELGAISPSKSFCLKAMDEYAKEVAMDFCGWISEDNFLQVKYLNQEWKWCDSHVAEYGGAPSDYFSTDELYSMYLQSKQKNNDTIR